MAPMKNAQVIIKRVWLKPAAPRALFNFVDRERNFRSSVVEDGRTKVSKWFYSGKFWREGWDAERVELTRDLRWWPPERGARLGKIISNQ